MPQSPFANGIKLGVALKAIHSLPMENKEADLMIKARYLDHIVRSCGGDIIRFNCPKCKNSHSPLADGEYNDCSCGLRLTKSGGWIECFPLPESESETAKSLNSKENVEMSREKCIALLENILEDVKIVQAINELRREEMSSVTIYHDAFPLPDAISSHPDGESNNVIAIEIPRLGKIRFYNDSVLEALEDAVRYYRETIDS